MGVALHFSLTASHTIGIAMNEGRLRKHTKV
jgi:hypothetical protein